MSRYYIQENLLTANQPTIVRNEQSKTVFLMVGTWGSRGQVFSLYTPSGDLIASVKQVSLHTGVGSRFDLYYRYKKIGSLRRLVSFQRDFYFIHQLAWLAIGNIPQHEYSIYSVQKKLMDMQKSYHAKGNFYELNISQDDYAPVCICIAAILDYWQRNFQKETAILHDRRPNYGWSFKFKEKKN